MKTSHFQKTKKPPNYNVLVHKQSGLAQWVGPRSPEAGHWQRSGQKVKSKMLSPALERQMKTLQLRKKKKTPVPSSCYFRGMSDFADGLKQEPRPEPERALRSTPDTPPGLAWPFLSIEPHLVALCSSSPGQVWLRAASLSTVPTGGLPCHLCLSDPTDQPQAEKPRRIGT